MTWMLEAIAPGTDPDVVVANRRAGVRPPSAEPLLADETVQQLTRRVCVTGMPGGLVDEVQQAQSAGRSHPRRALAA